MPLLTAAQLQRVSAATHRPCIQAGSVADVPPFRYEASRFVADVKLPTPDSALVYEVVRTATTNQQLFALQIYQRRGNVLDAVYLTSKQAPSLAAVATAGNYARIAGEKLARLVPAG